MPPEFDSWLPPIAQARTETIELISRIASTRQLTVGVTHNDIFRWDYQLANLRAYQLLGGKEVRFRVSPG